MKTPGRVPAAVGFGLLVACHWVAAADAAEAPDRTDDSGWRVFAGDESDEYSSAPGNAVDLPLRDLIDRDPSLKEILRPPARCAFERKDPKERFQRVEDFDFGES